MTSTASSPLVSIIVPFRNAGSYLREAIESVRAQTYERWELILFDDGSTDESPDVAREYAAADPGRVRYAQHPGGINRGTSTSRNAAIRLSRGSLIALLDSDDVWLPRKLAEQVALLVEHADVGMLYGESQYWYSWSGRPEDQGRDMYPDVGVDTTAVVAPPTLLVRCLLGRAAVPCPCSVIVRRDAVERVGGFEEGFNNIIEDQAFFAKIMLEERTLVATERWDRYRQHAASVSWRAKRARTVRAARLEYLEWLGRYLAARGVTNGPVREALRRDTWKTRHPRLTRLMGRLVRTSDDRR